MKRLIICLFLTLISLIAWGQQYRMYRTDNYHNQLRLNTATGEVVQFQDDGQSWLITGDKVPNGGLNGRFILYKTQNMWTFIELDTFTGRLWQVQFSVKGIEYMFAIPINEYVLSDSYRSVFTIEPMTSMYQFYLINQETGEMWKFQWSTKTEDGYRWIEKI